MGRGPFFGGMPQGPHKKTALGGGWSLQMKSEPRLCEAGEIPDIMGGDTDHEMIDALARRLGQVISSGRGAPVATACRTAG